MTVLGLGNLLLGDDGVGVRTVWRLQQLLGEEASLRLLDGGTLGIDLLNAVEESSHLVVVDSLSAGKPPGSVTVLEGQAATSWESAACDAHGLGLPTVFALARLRGWAPLQVAVVGVEPGVLAPGVGLSAAVEAAVGTAAERVLQLLQQWGVHPKGG